MTIPGSATSFDTFHRTSSSGWGTSDSGDIWSSIGAGGSILGTDWTVATPVAHHSVPAAGAYRMSYLADPDLTIADLDISGTGSVAFTSGVTGANLEILGLMFRGLTTSSYYLARVEVAIGGSMTLKLLSPDGVTTLASVTGIVGALTYTTGKTLSIRVRAIGPRIKIRVWDPAGAEPSTWDISVQDTTRLAAGFVGLRSGVASSNTNTKPVIFTWTQFWAGPPEVITGSTGRPFLPVVLGSSAAIATEIAPGADLSADPDTWPWTEITPRHADGTSTTIGRTDNVGASPAAQYTCGLNNPNGDYSPLDPDGTYYPNLTRNMPVRQILTIDGSTWRTRFQGYLSSLVPTSDLSGRVSTVALTALGMLGRVSGRKRPLRSALYRKVSTLTGLAAYWPCEDLTGATTAANAVAGGNPLTVKSGTAAFGYSNPPAGSVGAIDISASADTLIANITMPPATTGWAFGIAFRATSSAPGAVCNLITITTPSYLWAFGVADGSAAVGNETVPGIVHNVNTGGSDICSNCAFIDAMDGNWHLYIGLISQHGTGFSSSAYLDGVFTGIITGASATGPVTAVQIGKAPGAFGFNEVNDADLEIAHVWFTNDPTDHGVGAALDGYDGETASDRMIRLAAELGIQLDLLGSSDVTMGPQGIDTAINLFRSCETVDHGVLFDGLGPGFGYICRSAVYAVDAAYTLDMSAQEVTSPSAGYFDLQGITNIVTANREGGSSATIERVDGPTGTDLIGDDDTSDTLNVDSDDVLPFHAGFLAALGTPFGYRVPSISPNVRILAAKLPTMIAAGMRHRFDVINTPRRELGPDGLQLLAEGWTETTAADDWAQVLNTSPYAPFNVLVLGDDDARLAAGDASTLHANITSSATSFTVDIASGPLWTTAVGDFPLDVAIGGERIRLSSITGTSSPQTFHVATSGRSINGVVKAHTALDVVEVFQPAVLAL